MNNTQDKIEMCKTHEMYFPISCGLYSNRNIIKDILYQVLVHKDFETDLFLFCSESEKFLFLEHFWKEDFIYVGTRIKIISDKDFETKEISSQTGMPKTKILVCADKLGDFPIAFIELIR
jgi:hypothetical protein